MRTSAATYTARVIEASWRTRLEAFVAPLYQDLDGTSRVDEVERIAAIARRLHRPDTDEETRAFELLLLFHLLGFWLEKLGNVSRAVLATGAVSEAELRETARSIRRLAAPQSASESAVAAAVLIDRSGVRGLTESFGRARREGNSIMDVLRAALADVQAPEWLTPRAAEWLYRRREARREVCRRLLEELELDDLN